MRINERLGHQEQYPCDSKELKIIQGTEIGMIGTML